jgi:5'(3')-deoxyribonucleotidase
MTKPVVLFDADGFLLDFLTPALMVASNVVGRPYKVEDFTSWDIFGHIGKEHERACYAEYEKPGFCASFEPYPGAVEGVREAQKMADVVVVTSPLHSPTWCHERKQSLYKHFDIPSKNIIFASRKSLVQGRMLVDDRPSHANEWAAANPPYGLGVIWAQPYNRNDEKGSRVTRCSSWTGPDGLLSLIEAMLP